MSFTLGLPIEQACMRVQFDMLARMLLLPEGVRIVGARPDPNDAHAVILDLKGPVPATGELAPEYDQEWIRHTRLRGLRQL